MMKRKPRVFPGLARGAGSRGHSGREGCARLPEAMLRLARTTRILVEDCQKLLWTAQVLKQMIR
jgi:hypothetical protein